MTKLLVRLALLLGALACLLLALGIGVNSLYAYVSRKGIRTKVSSFTRGALNSHRPDIVPESARCHGPGGGTP